MDDSDPYHEHYLQMATLIERLMDRTLATPDDVALRIQRTLESPTPPLRVYATIDAHVFALLRRILPRGAYHRLLYATLPRIWTWGKGSAGLESGKPQMDTDGHG